MTATLHDSEVDRYLTEVAAHVGVLAERERAELLDDLREHLVEVAAEDDGSLVSRLGPPADYAAELLASAGLAPDQDVLPRSVVERAAMALGRIRTSPAYRRTVAFLPELRPGWWVARALLATYAFAVAVAGDRDRVWPLPDALDLALVAVVAAVAVIVSVVAGQRAAVGRGRRTGIVADVVVVVAMVLALGSMHQRPIYGNDTIIERQPGLFDGQGQPITNIYPYGADGQLLHGVLLYDQHGQPIDVRAQAEAQGIVSQQVPDANGAPIPNAFPYDQRTLSYGDQGTPAGQPPAIVVPRQSTTATTEALPPAPVSGAG